MTPTLARFCIAALLAAWPVSAAQREGSARLPAQPAPERPAQAAPRPEAPAVILDDSGDARQTRDRLMDVLRQYPPSVAQVLKLDPSLIRDADYLASYPVLAAFLGQHPDVAHNPDFFFGNVRMALMESNLDPRSEAVRAWRQVLEGLTVFAVILTITLALGWLVRTVIDHRRWQRLSKIQTDAHTKLLDRFASNEDLLAYIQTPSGRRFLESAPIQLDPGPRTMAAPLGRILWSVQAGLVLASGGVGLQVVSGRVVDEVGPQLSVMGVLAVALGIGFIVSAVVAFVLSRRLGLFEPPPGEPATRPANPTLP